MLFRIFHKQTGPESISDQREMIEEIASTAKEYSRFPQHALPDPTSVQTPFHSLLENRVSVREFDQAAHLPIQHISDILYATGGLQKREDNGSEKRPTHTRHHPSGGGLYPLEYYIAVYRVKELRPALYHYRPQGHVLEEMLSADHEAIFASSHELMPAEKPAALIVMTSVWGRNYFKYGEFAYRLSLLEAGHSMQDLVLSAEARDVRTCPGVGFRQDIVTRALDIEHEHEDPLYICFLGV